MIVNLKNVIEEVSKDINLWWRGHLFTDFTFLWLQICQVSYNRYPKLSKSPFLDHDETIEWIPFCCSRHCGRLLCASCSDKSVAIIKYNLTKQGSWNKFRVDLFCVFILLFTILKLSQGGRFERWNSTGWGGHLFRRFCNMFSKSPPPCLLGQHGSCSV